MGSLWNAADRASLQQRLDGLRPDAEARWGRLSAAQMLTHLVDSFRMGLGELPVRTKKSVLNHAPFKQIIIYLLPFPKHAPTARQLLTREPGVWSEELATCHRLVDRFATEPRDRRWPEHPIFGKLSARAWGVLGYTHTDHHLRQFGV